MSLEKTLEDNKLKPSTRRGYNRSEGKDHSIDPKERKQYKVD